ncbi:MAG: nucleotide exchange factor GrpE [Chloroflexi bacterium]|nr:nucleotide exchange factor GrpE [Chloroflexota bacterium]
MIRQEPEEEQAARGEARVGEEDITALKQALAGEKEKAAGYLANWQRAQADLMNYKRRSEQEKEEVSRFANLALLLNVVSVLDDFERALAAVPANQSELPWLDGIRLIERKLRISLEAQGLSHIPAVGEPFDPRFHEAIRQDKGKEGIVIAEVHRGYKLYDRVIRPSKVVVGNGEVETVNNS